MTRERTFTFRGQDFTLCLDADGNWTLYEGGSCDPVDESTLTDEEVQKINDYVYDWRTDP
jgi:hypothetical protein